MLCKHVRQTIVPIFLICTNHFSKHRIQCSVKSFNHSVPLRVLGRCSQFVDTHQIADSLKYGAFKVRPSISQYLQRSTDRTITTSTNAFATVQASSLVIGMASTNFVKLSMTVNINMLLPRLLLV